MQVFFLLHIICSLGSFFSMSSSNKNAYVFVLSAQNYFIIFPFNSSLNIPITFLFIPMGKGFLSFLS